jgi:hypothetical protein
MTAKDKVICWNPDSDQVAIFTHPMNGRGRNYRRSVGACDICWRNLSFKERSLKIAGELLTIALRDNVPLAALHKALSPLDEYAALLAEDVPLGNGRSL